MATRKRERFIALFFAVLFLASSSVVGLAVILDNMSNKDNDAASQQTSTTKKSGENMLQGTQLQNFTPVASIPELQKLDVQEGSGQEVKASDTVTVDYTGAVAATGTIFQSSKDSGQPISFPLNGVIAGWTQGVPGMKVGGTRRLLIPAKLAYGATPPAGSGIPVNADLVFDITLYSIGQ